MTHTLLRELINIFQQYGCGMYFLNNILHTKTKLNQIFDEEITIATSPTC
jgi:hypothetical protein